MGEKSLKRVRHTSFRVKELECEPDSFPFFMPILYGLPLTADLLREAVALL